MVYSARKIWRPHSGGNRAYFGIIMISVNGFAAVHYVGDCNLTFMLTAAAAYHTLVAEYQ